ncbi:MAG: hypothetical protein ACO3ZZ_05650, partial [Solirubrobacterales bacterium]
PALSSAFVTVIAASVFVTVALAGATHQTVQQANEVAAATEVGRSWAEDNGELLVTVAYEGNALVFLVEGDADGSNDPELSRRLEGKVPEGTSLVVNRVPGERRSLPPVGG